jgi:hypothetical protein
MKININIGKTWTPFAKVEKGKETLGDGGRKMK